MHNQNDSKPNFELFLNDPNAMRKNVLEWRKNIPYSERQKIFSQICERFCLSEIYQKSHSILAYHGKVSSGEFDTVPLLTRILHDGKKLLLPKVNTIDFGLQIFQVTDMEKELKLGRYGIIEPDNEVCKSFQLESIDLILVPGLVFDCRGYRYGYGKGYYDWLLERSLKYKIHAVGLLDERLLLKDSLKIHEKDRRVDYIFTNTKVYTTIFE